MQKPSFQRLNQYVNITSPYKAVIAMSGGIDSSVAAALTLEQNLQCVGVTFKLYRDKNSSCSIGDIDSAKSAASSLGIPHYEIDFYEEFKKQVICHFIETYENGEVSNPCIECNRRIKFNFDLIKDRQFDFDFLVTGHYARIKQDKTSGRFLLRKALDDKKDQSFMLYTLTQQQLEKIRFPLGDLTKKEVRKLAENKYFFNTEKSESQNICFVPDGDYGKFIEEYTGKTYPPGNIMDPDGYIIGRHQGLIRYTIGQCRGLGAAANKPVYVTSKSSINNTITVGPESALYSKSITAKDINLIACDNLKKSMRVMVKTSSLQDAQAASAEQKGRDTLHIEFDTPQRAITRGQAVVMYEGDIVIGGGTIC